LHLEARGHGFAKEKVVGSNPLFRSNIVRYEKPPERESGGFFYGLWIGIGSSLNGIVFG